MIDRTQRPHVTQRLAENTAYIARGDVQGNHPYDPLKPSLQLQRYHDYVRGAVKETPEPEAMTNEELLEQLDCYRLDSSRYGSPGSEQNFLIMAYAGEWCQDLKAEILKRMVKS